VIEKRDLLGAPIAVTDYEEAMNEMERMIASREPGYVCAVPVHSLMVSRHDEGMRAALRGATMNVPDGWPLVWALNLLGEQLRDRVYGPDLMDRFCARPRAGVTASGCTAARRRKRWTGSSAHSSPATPLSRSPAAGRRPTGR
jgi:UDP-N-acetyl-D-mannosaminuronic acid transferase (WecB/TagA/CpsF family)